MGYLYGSRLVYEKAESDPVVQSLRKELYCEDYESIQWMKTRHSVAPMDDYSPINPIMATIQNALARYESWSLFRPFRDFVRRRGLAYCVDYMTAEDLQTNFIDIGPVNKVLNMLSAFHALGRDADHTTLLNHFARVPDYLWFAEDGLRVKGYNGSQCWDTSFAIQAIYEANLLDEFPDVSRKVWSYLERTQILSTETSQNTVAYGYESPDNRRKYFRHISEGGWPFSTSAHGWPIADCTSEGLKGVLCLMRSSTVNEALAGGSLKPIGEARLQNAVNVLLSYQNEDGGWATYENNRGFGWYEALNPSEVFGDIMIDYSYVELSMASLTALAEFQEFFPKHRSQEISFAIRRGRSFLKSIQRGDGSWYGSWACCFCYGVWFGVEGLIKAGEPKSSECIKKACQFLLRHQRDNGGWGEDFTSCYDKDYSVNGMEDYGDGGSGVVNTAWALLALSMAEFEDVEAVKRGIQYLVSRQLPSGDWPQEGIAGVFNRACGISYTAYRNVFPIWAIGRCKQRYGSILDV
jgi:squalene/oxidosqualene cyclase-like protein